MFEKINSILIITLYFRLVRRFGKESNIQSGERPPVKNNIVIYPNATETGNKRQNTSVLVLLTYTSHDCHFIIGMQACNYTGFTNNITSCYSWIFFWVISLVSLAFLEVLFRTVMKCLLLTFLKRVVKNVLSYRP